MDRPRAAVSSTPSRRQAWPAVGGDARGTERCAVDPAHRGALARSAAPLSAVPNVSSALSNVATDRCPRTRAARPGRKSARSWPARSLRSLHRRQLQLGEKGGSAINPTRRGKGSKIMAICDGHGLPLAVHVASASPHEVRLVDATLAASFLDTLPARLIADRAYDSDGLDAHLAQTYGIEMIAAHRPHRRTRPKTAAPCGGADAAGRSNASLPGSITTAASSRSWERHAPNFLGMIHLASAVIPLRASMR